MSTARKKVLCIVGARPNFMKIAPVMRALRAASGIEPLLVHTGQHYDESMSLKFFRQLGIPDPAVNLEVGSASHAVQTAEVMRRFDGLLDQPLGQDAAMVVVVGDVNSTLGCALVAVKRQIKVAHVEAGLRSFDRTMPEEINRVLTDQISDLLFVSEPSGMTNLANEGVPAARCHLVGNVMIDSLLASLEHAVPSRHSLGILFGKGAVPARYGVVTLHRPANVDDPIRLKRIMGTLVDLSRECPLVFPVHPRTASGIEGCLPSDRARLVLAEPLGYFEMLGLVRDAAIVVTDSGGLQEETTALGVPCLTLRANTERPITIEEGTNCLIDGDTDQLVEEFGNVLAGNGRQGRIPELWDGRAAQRIACLVQAALV